MLIFYSVTFCTAGSNSVNTLSHLSTCSSKRLSAGFMVKGHKGLKDKIVLTSQTNKYMKILCALSAIR